MSKKAAIFCGGSLDHSFCENQIRTWEPDLLIAVDAGMEFFYETGRIPDVIIGDFDSADPRILRFFEETGKSQIIRLNPEKDDTDTQAAISLAMNRQCKFLQLYGATGTRIDHMMGNLHLLGMGLADEVSICIMDPCNRIRMVTKELQINKMEQYGKYVSVLPFTGEAVGVTLSGMKYPLENYTLKPFTSLGISNEIQEEIAVIQLKEGILLVVESKDMPDAD